MRLRIPQSHDHSASRERISSVDALDRRARRDDAVRRFDVGIMVCGYGDVYGAMARGSEHERRFDRVAAAVDHTVA